MHFRNKISSYAELLNNGTVISSFDDETFRSTFEFRERPWPKRCTISFSIPSFSFEKETEAQRGEEKGQVKASKPDSVLYYKGTFKVSLLNRKVVLMRGSVYKASKRIL